MAALVGAHRDCVGVLLDSGAHDVGDAAVVPQVHHFRALRLQQAPDHIDRGVVAVEQRCGGNEAQWCGASAGLARNLYGRSAHRYALERWETRMLY